MLKTNSPSNSGDRRQNDVSSDPSCGLEIPSSSSCSEQMFDNSNVAVLNKRSSNSNDSVISNKLVTAAASAADDEDSSSVEILPEPESDRYPPGSSSNYVGASTAAVTIPAVITTTPDNELAKTHATVGEDSKMPALSQERMVREEDEDKEKAIGVSPDGRWVELPCYSAFSGV